MKKIAVIGAGQWGKNVVRTFAELGALVAVAEASAAIRADVGASYPEVPFYSSYDSILTNEAIEAVAIATPVATHFAIAREALLAGKDVFVEKPMTLYAEEARELHRLARKMGRILMVGHLLLYQPAIQWIKQYFVSGELGEVYSLHQQRAKLGRVRTVENVLWSLGVHDVAVLLHLVGEEPVQVAVHGQRVLQREIEDDVHLHLTFQNGVQAHLHTSWLWPEQERRLVVIGSRGMLVYDELQQTVTLHRKTIEGDLSARDAGSEVVFAGHAEPLRVECEHFLACIANRETPLSDGENGIAVISVIEAAIELLKEGCL
jgi:predicted dehydrogenase